jgi:signal transduction histidine kinase
MLLDARRSIGGRVTGRLPGWFVPAALGLAAAALAALSVDVVLRETRSRRQLLQETYRQMADLDGARLADEIRSAEGVARTIADADQKAEGLVSALDGFERSRPWLAAAVALPRPTTSGAETIGTPPSEFDVLLAAADREEITRGRPAAAAGLYQQALGSAASGVDRLRAWNGLGRALLKAQEPARARDAYRAVVSHADTLVPREAYWAAVAWNQILDCDRRLLDQPAETSNAIGFLEFVTVYRYVLDPDAAELYRRFALEAIERTRERLDASGRARLEAVVRRSEHLVAMDRMLAEVSPNESGGAYRRVIDGAQARVGLLITAASLSGFLDRTVPDSPASNVALALIDVRGRSMLPSAVPVPPDAARAGRPAPGSPDWYVAALPRAGSLSAEAARDVRRYALWLALVFSTVVVALLLAARSIRRELALARLRTDFVSNVSHELKTPLSLIRMFAESLREGWVSDAQRRDYYDVITRESERLTGLINNVLDFSRIEAGTRPYRFVLSDVRQVVADLLDRYESHLKAASIELVRRLPGGPVHARIDRDAIEQTLVNLLSNAVKYMGGPDRSPRTVTVTLEALADRLELRVADTGIGMNDEQRRRIFQRFFRADDEAVRAVAGSGLGLTLVEAHVEAHAGTIAVDSEPGRGSTFTIGLPVTTEGAAS